MSKFRNIREALIWLIDGRIPLQVETGKVISVDDAKRTCVVDPEDGRAKVEDVRLQSVEAINGQKLGLLIKPSVGSYVCYALIENDKAQNYITETSEIDELLIENEAGVSLKVLADGTLLLNGDGNKGVVKVDALVQELDDIKQDINALKNVFFGWVPVPNDGGAALKAAAGSWFGQQMINTNSNSLQNQKVKHGG
jgi:hypothetical protein